jgi:hypothetical protein
MVVAGQPPAAGTDWGAHGAVSRVRAFFASQVHEISADGVLRLYGAALALTHVLSVLFWLISGSWQYMHEASEPICWPLVPWCATLRVLSPAQMPYVLLLFAAAAVAVALAFSRRRWTVGA